MKTVKRELSYSNYYDIMGVLTNNEATIESFESVLNDGGLYEGLDVKIGRYKPRKYIVLIPEFATTQSDSLFIVLTDSEKEAYELLNPYLLNN